jgi:hypothetical protein
MGHLHAIEQAAVSGGPGLIPNFEWLLSGRAVWPIGT